MSKLFSSNPRLILEMLQSKSWSRHQFCKTTLTTSSNLPQGRPNYYVFVMSPGSLIRSDDLLFLKHFYSIQSNAGISIRIVTIMFQLAAELYRSYILSVQISHIKKPRVILLQSLYTDQLHNIREIAISANHRITRHKRTINSIYVCTTSVSLD